MEIMVLSTLHQLHGKVDYYSFEHLSQIIERFSPDVLAVELTPTDLKSRKAQGVKQEYQNSVYPLLDKLQCEVIPLEPAEPMYSELVALGKQAVEELENRSPAVLEQFGLYVNTLYGALLDWWNSPMDVNSDETDRHIEIKHRYQNALFGKDQEMGWERWNQHFLGQILKGVAKRQSGRMLVLVGLEHAYWLRKQLSKRDDVQLLAAATILSEIL